MSGRWAFRTPFATPVPGMRSRVIPFLLFASLLSFSEIGPVLAEETRIQEATAPPVVPGAPALPTYADLLNALNDPSLADLSSKQPLRDDILALLQSLTPASDAGVQYLHGIAQQDPALSAAVANRAIMTQLQTLTRWSQIQMLASFVQSSPDPLAAKALVHCVVQKLDAVQPVKECLTAPNGVADWSRVKSYLGVKDIDMSKEFSVLARHLPSDALKWAFTYIGDLRLRENRIKRIYCSKSPSNPKDKCEDGGTAYEYQDLGKRFGTVKGEVQAVVGSTCAPATIPTQITWNSTLPTSATIEVDRPSFVLAYKDSTLCGKLTSAMTAGALSHEVTYVLAVLSSAESDPGALAEEREAIRLVRQDLDRRHEYWRRNFDAQNQTYEVFVRQARERATSERAALDEALFARK